MVRTHMHSSFIGGMITALVLMGCSNFSDLAFQENTLSPNDSSSQLIALSLRMPSGDVAPQNCKVQIQAQGNPSPE